MRTRSLVFQFFLCLGGLIHPVITQAALITFTDENFSTTPVFSDVQSFSFAIDIGGPLTPGVYTNPDLNSVEYRVNGSLASGTSSGFPAFNLQRTITGNEFYDQGSSLSFEIATSADLSDGLQISELVGSDSVFVFNGREVDTGRYHPPLFQLNSDGTGSIRNSNNMGGINPSSNEVVDLEFGDEYITNLSFDANELTIAAVVPLPSSIIFFGSAVVVGAAIRRRKTGSPPHKVKSSP